MHVVTPNMASAQRGTLLELSKQSPILFFDNFADCLAPLYAKQDLPDEVKIPKSIDYLLQGDFEPARVIDLRSIKKRLKYGELPIWRNLSNKEFSLHGFGLIEDNKSKPSQFTLFDTSPHMFLGGATGHGKSVTLNDIIMAGALVHPPWKVQYYLNDPKITELKPYALHRNVIPHVNTVAATEDPQYTISMLEYLIDYMNKRNKVFTLAKVKNINAFNQSTGLEMPMLVLVLDECKSMYLKAAKKAAYIDKLIELFVALARNAGGRCIMASQQPVTEMSKDTMANVNIRAALGCNPVVSTSTIGNVGAANNLNKRGKLAFNNKPGDGNIKDNVYLSSPFLPDEPRAESRWIYDVFDYLSEMWELCGGGRLEQLSFFDESAKLTREEFCSYIDSRASMTEFFLGEPAFIYKERHPYFNFSLLPSSEFETSLASNILCMSPIASMRYNITALLMANLTAISKKTKTNIRMFSNIKDVSDKMVAMKYPFDVVDYAMDIEQLFYGRVNSILYRYCLCLADERVFGNKAHEGSETFAKLIEEAELSGQSELMTKRFNTLLAILQEPKSRLILQLDELDKKSRPRYIAYLQGFANMYKQLGCLTKQLLPQHFATDFNIFVEFDQLKGVEIKTVAAKLEQWFDVIRMGPIYRVYTIIVTAPLINSGMYVAPAFDNLIFYGTPDAALNPFKGIRDFYPESIGSMLFVYANRKLPKDYCFKIKWPHMLPSGRD